MKAIRTNSHAALRLVTPPEESAQIGNIRVVKLPHGPATFSVRVVDQAAPPEAPAGREEAQEPRGRPARRKTPSVKPQKAQVPKKKARSADKARSGKPARQPKTAAKPPSKKAKVLALLQRRQGATLQELRKATGWQAHSVRGFLSGTIAKRMGLLVRSEKCDDGERVYSILE